MWLTSKIVEEKKHLSKEEKTVLPLYYPNFRLYSPYYLCFPKIPPIVPINFTKIKVGKSEYKQTACVQSFILPLG